MIDDPVHSWLQGSPWKTWARYPLAGDASARRYERLIGPGEHTAILMIAPPQVCGSQRRFFEIAKHLNAHGIAAPVVHEWDEAKGLMVMSDLGSADYAQTLKTSPSDEPKLYQAATEVLKALQAAPVPAGLDRMTPEVGAAMLGPAFEWGAIDTSPELQVTIKNHMQELLTKFDTVTGTLSLRDFHAENLIWRGTETGLARVGVLDFQDAFITHPVYDLASLLRDARRDVSNELMGPLLRQLLPNVPAAEATTAFYLFAVQRNLRIVGIFHALAQRDGKVHYLSLLPRVWRHLMLDLSAPELEKLRTLVVRAFKADEVS